MRPQALVATEGRRRRQVLILPGISPMIASTEPSAAPGREVNELRTRVGRKRSPAGSAGTTSRTFRWTAH